MKIIFIALLLFSVIQSYSQDDSQQSEDLNDLSNCDNLIKTGKTQAERDELQKDYWTLLGIVTELSRFRNLFLQEGELINLFPTAYYHTTYTEMRLILANQYKYPIEKMKQMISFYEAYITNRNKWEIRQKEFVERHWKEHFEFCEKMQIHDYPVEICAFIGSVLATGIIAHVKYDLPRAIKFAFNSRYNKSLFYENLIGDFNKTDAIFPTTVAKTTHDISNSLKGCIEEYLDILTTGNRVEIMISDNLSKLPFFNVYLKKTLTGADVKNMRHQAWSNANSISFKGIDGKY